MREIILIFCLSVLTLLNACTEKTPGKPLEQMSTQELHVVAKGRGDDAKYARVRLAGFDIMNGGDEEKQRAISTVLQLADQGYERAKIELCRDIYWENGPDEVVLHCLEMARSGHLGAADQICRIWFVDQEFDESLSYCKRSAEAGRPAAYLPYGYALFMQEDFESAYDWLVKTVEIGPFEDKIYAVDTLVQIPDEVLEVHDYSLNRRPKRTSGTIFISDVIDKLPPPDSLGGRKGRCEFEIYYTPTGIAYDVITHCSEQSLDDYLYTYLMNLKSPAPGQYYASKRLTVNWN